MDHGSVILSGISSKRVLESINMVVSHYKKNMKSFDDISGYKNLNLSKQVVRTILSYIDVVNRDTWKKTI